MAINLGSAYGIVTIDASGVSRSTKEASTALGQLTNDAKSMSSAMQPAALALSAVAAACSAVIVKSTLTAARTEELGMALTAVAANAQKTALANGDLGKAEQLLKGNLDKVTESIKAKGITTQVALSLTAQFARYNLDLAKSTDLARVSQDAAVLSMENSSENLDGLMYGIITYNQRILRTHGINVDLSKAFDTEAAAIGKTADTMNEAEKVAATLNAVIAEGGRLTGTYEAAMDSAGKRLRSMDRYWEEARNNLGKAFLPVMAKLVDTATEVLKAFNALNPAQQQAAGTFMVLTAAVTGAVGGFVLLAPRILQTVNAMVQMSKFGGDVVAGLQLMKAGATGAEVASTGFAGATAAALPVVLALAAALIAAAKAYEFYQGIQKRTAEVEKAWTGEIENQIKAGKAVEDVMREYAATQARVRGIIESTSPVLQLFIDKQRILTAGADEYLKILGDSSISQAAYEAEAKKVAETMGGVIDEQGNLIRVFGEGETQTIQLVKAHFLLTEAERENARVTKQLADSDESLRSIHKQMADVEIPKTTEQFKAQAEATDDLRDKQAALADESLNLATQFEALNSKSAERADLVQKLATLEATMAKQGTAHTEINKKYAMSAQELESAQSKLAATEESLYTIKQKKGETDTQLEARGDALALTIENLRNKISLATGATKDNTVVVGGATKAQQDERQAIMDKITAMDAAMAKELAQQAVESLTPEMFGTGAEAAAKYEAAKRGLMLATGLVTEQSLAEKDAIGLLTTALATGQISPEQYAIALGKIKGAAQDGKVSIGELVTQLSGTKFSLKNLDDSATAVKEKAKVTYIDAGREVPKGAAQGVMENLAIYSDALNNMADAGITAFRLKNRMESPSLVFADMGRDLMAGLAQGVQGSAAVLVEALNGGIDLALSGTIMQIMQATQVGLSYNSVLMALAMESVASGAATLKFNDAMLTAKNTVENEVNRVLGGVGGTIEDLQKVKELAGAAMGTMAIPLLMAFGVMRDGAAMAGSAIGGVAAGLSEIKAIGNITNTITTIHIDIYRTREEGGTTEGPSKGDGGGGAPSGGGGGGGACFLAGTPVWMEDGSTVPIERVRVGDRVISYDLREKRNVTAQVVKTIVHPPRDVVGWIAIHCKHDTDFDTDTRIVRVTPEHPLWVNGKTWTVAGLVCIGDRLLGIDGHDAVVTELEWVDGSVEVYNLYTNHETHNYFVGGVLVHNGEQKQAGGWTRQGWAYMHPNEYVLSEAMRMGRTPVAAGALAPAAVAKMAGAEKIINDYRVTIYGGLTLEGVQDKQSLLSQLQEMG